MVDVGGNDRSSARHFLAHKFRRDEFGDVGAEALAVAQTLAGALHRGLARQILAMGDINHLFSDDSGASEFELGDELARPACAERPFGGTERRKTIRGNVTIVLRLDRARLRFGKVPRFNPGLAHWLQPRGKIDCCVALGIGPGRIVDPHRRLIRVGERDLAKRNADVGAPVERGVDLPRANNRPSGHSPRRGELGNLVHGRLLAYQIRRGNGRTNGGMRPLRPFAGMTRIRFKGFGLSPSQPRSGRPSSKANVVRAARSVNSLSKQDFYADWRRGAVPQGPRCSHRPTRLRASPAARLRACGRRSGPRDGQGREHVLSQWRRAYAIDGGPPRRRACKGPRFGRRNDETPPPSHTPERTMAWSSADASSDRRSLG